MLSITFISCTGNKVYKKKTEGSLPKGIKGISVSHEFGREYVVVGLKKVLDRVSKDAYDISYSGIEILFENDILSLKSDTFSSLQFENKEDFRIFIENIS